MAKTAAKGGSTTMTPEMRKKLLGERESGGSGIIVAMKNFKSGQYRPIMPADPAENPVVHKRTITLYSPACSKRTASPKMFGLPCPITDEIQKRYKASKGSASKTKAVNDLCMVFTEQFLPVHDIKDKAAIKILPLRPPQWNDFISEVVDTENLGDTNLYAPDPKTGANFVMKRVEKDKTTVLKITLLPSSPLSPNSKRLRAIAKAVAAFKIEEYLPKFNLAAYCEIYESVLGEEPDKALIKKLKALDTGDTKAGKKKPVDDDEEDDESDDEDDTDDESEDDEDATDDDESDDDGDDEDGDDDDDDDSDDESDDDEDDESDDEDGDDDDSDDDGDDDDDGEDGDDDDSDDESDDDDSDDDEDDADSDDEDDSDDESDDDADDESDDEDGDDEDDEPADEIKKGSAVTFKRGTTKKSGSVVSIKTVGKIKTATVKDDKGKTHNVRVADLTLAVAKAKTGKKAKPSAASTLRSKKKKK